MSQSLAWSVALACLATTNCLTGISLTVTLGFCRANPVTTIALPRGASMSSGAITLSIACPGTMITSGPGSPSSVKIWITPAAASSPYSFWAAGPFSTSMRSIASGSRPSLNRTRRDSGTSSKSRIRTPSTKISGARSSGRTKSFQPRNRSVRSVSVSAPSSAITSSMASRSSVGTGVSHATTSAPTATATSNAA